MIVYCKVIEKSVISSRKIKPSANIKKARLFTNVLYECSLSISELFGHSEDAIVEPPPFFF